MSALIWNVRRRCCREPQFHCKWAATVNCFTAYTGNRIWLCNSRAGRGAAFNQLGKKKKKNETSRWRAFSKRGAFVLVYLRKGNSGQARNGEAKQNKKGGRRGAHNASRTQERGLWKLDTPRSKMNLSTPKPVLPKYPVLWTLVISFMKCTSDWRTRVCTYAHSKRVYRIATRIAKLRNKFEWESPFWFVAFDSMSRSIEITSSFQAQIRSLVACGTRVQNTRTVEFCNVINWPKYTHRNGSFTFPDLKLELLYESHLS